jgi:type IV pilus assembly protein PilV
MLKMTDAIRVRRGSSQGGSILLEALIAILIFSVGILAVVGMQTTAVRAASDAKYRSDASLLASELIGQMWVTDRTNATLLTFQGGIGGVDGAAYTTWLANVTAALPGATVAAGNPPVVNVTASNIVTITVKWKLPSEPAGAAAHNYTVLAQVR